MARQQHNQHNKLHTHNAARANKLHTNTMIHHLMCNTTTHLLGCANHAHSAAVLLLRDSSQRRFAVAALIAIYCWIQLHCGMATAAAAACQNNWLTQQRRLSYRVY
jgi:hypothetical protein